MKDLRDRACGQTVYGQTLQEMYASFSDINMENKVLPEAEKNLQVYLERKAEEKASF